MNLFSEGALSLRRRSVWEATDAGILLWRNNFVHFIPFFALPLWIIACCLRLLPGRYFYLSYLILWWLKPFFDRLLLHVVSRRFFEGSGSGDGNGGNRPGALRRGILRTLFHGLFGDLLWRRFSPGRAARMPVRILERTDRKKFRQRKKALATGGLDFCSFLSVLGLGMEGLLLLGEMLFVVVLGQMIYPGILSYLWANMRTAELFIFAAYCLNYILAESLYVCMGFGLYINSRVEAEGWDLQLLFQKFAGPHPKIPGPAKSAVLLICLFLLAVPVTHGACGEAVASGGISAAPDTESADFFPEDFPSAAPASVEALKGILASKDFGSEKEGWGIRFKKKDTQKELPDLNLKLAPLLEKIRYFFGLFLRFLVILVLAAAAGFACYWFLKFYRNSPRHGGRYRDRGRGYTTRPVSAENPESLFARAEALYSRGLLREAWASCLSGYLGVYTGYRSLVFPADATEYDCLRLVRRALPDESGPFNELVQTWIPFAYGGIKPSDGVFEQVLSGGRSLLNIQGSRR